MVQKYKRIQKQNENVTDSLDKATKVEKIITNTSLSMMKA